jgi:hypothetical protein
MTSMPATYLQFDSTYRNRAEDPIPGEFSVPVEGTSNYFNSNQNNVNAGDPVASGSVEQQKKWASNAFSLYKVGEARTDPYWSNAVATSGTLSMPTTSDTVASADGSTNLLFGVQKDVRPQYLRNYYAGCKMDFSPDGGVTNYVAEVLSYEYFDDGRCQFLVRQRFTENIPAGTVFTMTDPTDIASGVIFVPNGVNWDDAYVPNRIIFNDTLNEWRPIQSYDKSTRLLHVEEGPIDKRKGQDGTIQTTGSCAHWSPQSTFSIRQVADWTPPISFNNGGLALLNPSPVNTTNNTHLWFEPKQFLTSTTINLGPNVQISPKNAEGTWIELTPNPGGTTTISNVNYQDTCTGGSTTTAILTTGPNSLWTQEDFYKGMVIKVDTYATGSLITINQNTGAATNFVATSYTVTVGTNNTYSGTTGTGMTFTLVTQATGTDDVVSATIVNAGTGYLLGETITMTQANLIAITGIATLTVTTPVILQLTAENVIGASQGADRIITLYESASKTVTFAGPLPDPLLNSHIVSMHPNANARVGNRELIPYPDPEWRNTPFMESAQITQYRNETGTLSVAAAAGSTSMVLNGASNKLSYTGHWISWIQGGGCYARMINNTTHNSDGTTTVSFDRPIGGIPATITLTNPGTGYTGAVGVATTLSSGTAGGSGLTVDTTVAAPPNPIDTVAINTAGNHYSVGDVVTVSGGGNDAEVTIASLEPVPQGTQWYIHSGKTKRYATGGFSGNGFTTNMNMQQWLLLPFFRDNAQPFSMSGSNVSLQSQVCYEIELISLIVPNAHLQEIGSSGRLAYYPFLFVSLTSPGTAGGTGPYCIMSNNPNSNHAQFIAPIDDVNHPDNATFLKLDGDGMVQTMKFNPYSTLQLRVTLPNGQPLQFKVNDSSPPQLPNPLGQLQAVFSLKRVA